MGLQFTSVEKRLNDSLIFPEFNLHSGSNQVTAIYSSLNVRNTLLQMLIREIPILIGEIHINNVEISKANLSDIGFSFLNEGLYERLTVVEQLNFYRKLYSADISTATILRKVHLEEKRNVRIKKLSYSEQRRIQFAKLLIQNPEQFIFEEPDQNIDIETQRVLIIMLEELRAKGKSVLILTGNMESAVILADKVFKLDQSGLHEIQIARESEEDISPISEASAEIDKTEIQPARFEKIPTKVNEKIVLFDPPEIDYIESNDGQSSLHINGEAFPTMFTMNELEERLQHFGFFRCHRSYIVNLQKVREVITWTRNSYSLILDDERKSNIPLSKTKMAEMKVMLGLK
ncbi:LytTR family transcriptional regulator DNA-binding domain-containing protein [Sporosarcina sp. E16_8]|uniref:LytTR family transcriptional regulator DNA-binding domain-containing protein n=1 Tax=Sporosarcina sp. E16_8 TaxID=2789295 RepID=UPI001A91E544|nr:LytTR family transcriptional regulator DNA-binding domain-containing protein [Sporosarcina sp. E16_8]MBO0588317.1 LytTR family transcriptional regulator DNA-binding domain-containing protein [Sporosarcina sp. E16_8]